MRKDIKGAVMRLEIVGDLLWSGVPVKEGDDATTAGHARRLFIEAVNLLRVAPKGKLTKAERATLKAGAGKGEEGGAA